ncbi:MAG: STAS domain-containing protein [Nitrospirae bacterium]|nr:STAS domain-containing protein [Nitrospirota bacterium]
MKIEISDYNGTKVFGISGDIDMNSSPELRRELLDLVVRKVPVLLVDFKGVSYIDSSGIATFVEGLKGMMPYGGRLKFFGIPQGIREIFSFSKLDRVFEIYPSIEDAFNR